MSLDTTLSFLLAFASSIAVARYLGPVKVGHYSYAVWLTSVAGALACYGIPMGARKYVAEYYGRGEPGLALAVLRYMLRLQLLLTLGLMCFTVTFVWVMSPAEMRVFHLLTCLSIAPQMAQAVYSQVAMALQDYSPNTIASLTTIPVTAAGVALSIYANLDLIGLAATLLAARTTDLVVRAMLVRRIVRKQLGEPAAGGPAGVDSELRSRLWKFSYQGTLLQVFNIFVWDRSELLFLARMGRPEQIAYFSLAYNITQQLLVVPRMFGSASGAVMMVRYGRGQGHASAVSAEALRYLALISLPVMIGLALLSQPLVRLLYGTAYLPVYPVLSVLAAGAIAKSLLLPAEQLLLASERQSELTRLLIATAVLKLVMDVVFIAYWGVMGAAMAMTLSQVLAVAGVWRLAHKLAGLQIPWQATGRYAAGCAVMALVVVYAGRLFEHPVLNIAVSVPAGAVGFLLSLRLLGAWTEEDRERFRHVGQLVPAFARGAYTRGMELIIR